MLEIYEVRKVIEGLAARLAARNANKRTIARLLKLERDYDASFDGSPSKYMAYNVAFHRTIVEMAGNTWLLQLIEQLELPAFLSLLHVIVDPPSAELSRAEHRPIVEAIVGGREKAASAAMEKHIARTARYVREHADEANFAGPRRRIAAEEIAAGRNGTKTRSVQRGTRASMHLRRFRRPHAEQGLSIFYELSVLDTYFSDHPA